ncbi:MAG: hypothetical protein QOD44_2985 [Solirubrobacteraceae bacterium]|nr:hypothetical protein [Solirubrobacteraceae bacterium]
MAGLLAALGAATLAATASAPPLSPAPPALQQAAVSRAPARTVPGAITRAERLATIDAADADVYRVVWRRAERDAKRLPPGRRDVVAGAVANAGRIAADGALTTTRLASVLAGVDASVRTARTVRTLPPAGGRVRLPGDSAVYSYRPPAGMQVHPLGTIGKLNALASTCTKAARRRGWHCRRAGIRAAADRLIALSVRDGGSLRFEYLFPFGGGRPGWISAMTQGTGAQALARAWRITGETRYRAAARAAYRSLVSSRKGAAVRRGGRVAHLTMYAFRPGMRVLNGEEQALIGVADYARITRDRRAAGLARRGARELSAQLPRFDTGAWTLYSLGGREADMNYHELAARFAGGLCDRALAHSAFCPAAARFARYTTQPPRLALAAAPRVRAPRRVTIALRASKQTAAWLTVRDRAGRVVLYRRLVLGRDGARFVLPVRRAGRHTITLDARAINGRAARATAVVTAKPPKPKPKPKPRPKAKAGAKPGTTAKARRDRAAGSADREARAAEKPESAPKAAPAKAPAKAHGPSRPSGRAS